MADPRRVLWGGDGDGDKDRGSSLKACRAMKTKEHHEKTTENKNYVQINWKLRNVCSDYITLEPDLLAFLIMKNQETQKKHLKSWKVLIISILIFSLHKEMRLVHGL